MLSQHLRLLVVEDNEDLRLSLEALFSDHGYDVETATTGAEALARLSSDPLPHLLLLDEWMPGLSGTEVVRQLQLTDRLRTLPVIILSGAPSASVAGPLRLAKPVEPAALLEAVRQRLDLDGEATAQRTEQA